MKPISSLKFGSALLIGFLLVGLMAFGLMTPLLAQGPDRADVVVQVGDGNILVRGVQFTAPISGFAALQATGLEVAYLEFPFGVAVCSIDGVGCPVSNCFCSSSNFWTYSQWDGSEWAASQVGAADTVLSNGAVEGWRWAPFGSLPTSDAPLLTATARAIDWLAAQQDTNGSYSDNVGFSAEVMIAAGAAGYDADDWRPGPQSPSLGGFIWRNGAPYSQGGAAAAGKLAVAVAAGEIQWPLNAQRPSSYYLAQSGIYTGGYGAGYGGAQAWAILGSLALSDTVAVEAVDYLAGAINADGGWGWSAGESDTNATALALQALVAAGEPMTTTAVMSGLTYLLNAQNPDAGFAYTFGSPSDANSTAYVIQALKALGFTNFGSGTGTLGTGSLALPYGDPYQYLLSLQLSNGAFEWQAGSGENQFATQQAIPALLGRALPINPRQRVDATILSGGSGTISLASGVTITLATGIFTDDIAFYYTPAPTQSTPGLNGVGIFYDLEAFFVSSGAPVGFAPTQTYTITVTYDPANVPPQTGETWLGLYRGVGAGWQLETSSQVDPAASTVTATPNHFSPWAVLAPLPRVTSLPIVFK